MSLPGSDPVLALLVRSGLALLFAHAAVHKVRHAREFRAALTGYGMVPPRWSGAIAVLLAGAESMLALALVGTPSWAPPALAAALLLVGYALVIAVTLGRGRAGIECGCGGPGGGQPVHWGLVWRNGALAAAALVAAAPAPARALTWIDGVTVVLGVPALALAYAAADAAFANAPRLAAMRASKGSQA